ncbi:MAG TPA: IS110 family transposase [Nitrosarchaeum sp.]|nr:IS110 family transposase [Nitrosarchaeum sp.]
MNHLGIDVGKRKCRASLKDDRGRILDEFFFGNNSDGIFELIERTQRYRTKKCNAVLESTGNMWMRIHDTLEDYGIDTILANPYRTKIIAQAKIKSDKLDARILSDLLRTGLVYESYVPVKEFREKRSLVRHRIVLSRTKTKLANKIYSLLDKYEYKTELTDVFGRSGINWLKSLSVSPIDKIILNTTLASIESIDSQIEIVSKEIARYAWQDSQDVKILISMTGIDIFSAMLISTEIVDIQRFSTPWKLVSYAGLSPSTRESSGKIKTGKITKQGSPLLRWILVQCALSAIRYDHHMRTFYQRIKTRKGHGKAIVATAKEMLVIIWYMLTSQQLYRYMNRTRYEQKLERLEKIGSQDKT